jgi:PTH1 family peptidyl-tRNA hydrolase
VSGTPATPAGSHDEQPHPGPFLVVGLGNPGPQYAGNRHNVGQMVLDDVVAAAREQWRTHKARAAVAELRLGTLPGGAPGPKVVLAKPSSYMNVSGGPVAGLAQFFSIAPEQVVVVHDELDLPFGTVRLKRGGGEGGHNGLRDISKALGSKQYVRVRVGVGRPPGRMDPADFVLRDFSGTERKELPFLLGDAADAIELVVLRGLTDAQQVVHRPV